MDKPQLSAERERLLHHALLVLGATLVVASLLFTGLLIFSWGPAASRRIARLRASAPRGLPPTPSQGGPLELPARSTPLVVPDAVWVDTRSHIYHFPGSSRYGTTIQGKYLREQDALAEGDRAALNERRPVNFGLVAKP